MIKTCPGLCGVDRRVIAHILAGATGGLLLPRAAQAATVSALAITCIDYRLVDDAVKFFAAQKLTGDYDQVSLAGASLAGVPEKFPKSNAAFWEHIGIAQQLHHIHKVIVVDHRDCGAFKVGFGKGYKSDHTGETAQHRQVMEQVKAHLATAFPDLTSEFYLMDLDGKTERVV